MVITPVFGSPLKLPVKSGVLDASLIPLTLPLCDAAMGAALVA